MKTIDIILEILEKIIPSIIAIIIVYFGYHIWIKQKVFEEKDEKLKEIRQAISNLLLIWRELSNFESTLNPNDPYNEIVFSNAKILRKFLKIDRSKINKLRKSYIETINNLKSYDITIFYNLEISFESYNNSFNDFLNPILNDKSINITNKYKLAYPLLQDNVKELEEIITETSKYLTEIEEKSVLNILHNHSDKINQSKDFEEIPEFIVDMANSFLPLKEEITKKDFLLLYNNETVKWLILRIIRTDLISFLSDGNNSEIFKTFLIFKDDNIKELNEFSKKFNKKTILDLLTITEMESARFVNNKEFYALIMGLVKKFTGVVPFEIKRFLVKLNNGEVDLKNKLEEVKLDISPLLTKDISCKDLVV